MIQKHRGKRRRWAAATVEMAVVMPLLLTILFGIIEYGWVFSVKQALVTAARDGARTAALPGSTTTEIQQRVADILRPMGVTTYNLQITRATAQNPTETVRITVPYAHVSLVGCFFGSNKPPLGARCSMRKEIVSGSSP